MKVRTYLNFGGNAREALHFYAAQLAGKVTSMTTFADMPPQAQSPGQPQMPTDGVMHARLVIGDTEIMASDAPANVYQPIRSAYLCLAVDTDQEAERVYKTLSAGGETLMPIGETFFAHRFGVLRDRFGVSWMVIHEKAMAAV